jgi:hypothetical protein
VQEFFFSTVNDAHAALQQYATSADYPIDRREFSDALNWQTLAEVTRRAGEVSESLTDATTVMAAVKTESGT